MDGCEPLFPLNSVHRSSCSVNHLLKENYDAESLLDHVRNGSLQCRCPSSYFLPACFCSHLCSRCTFLCPFTIILQPKPRTRLAAVVIWFACRFMNVLLGKRSKPALAIQPGSTRPDVAANITCVCRSLTLPLCCYIYVYSLVHAFRLCCFGFEQFIIHVVHFTSRFSTSTGHSWRHARMQASLQTWPTSNQTR